MANMKPESRNAGRKVATSAIWVASTCERETAEMKRPRPRLPQRKRNESGNSRSTLPRNGTPKSTTPKHDAKHAAAGRPPLKPSVDTPAAKDNLVSGSAPIVPPNSFALARTIEYFRIPRDVLTVCLGKSTYARCGIIVNVTPFEPEWEGHVTIEISNTTPLPAKIYANEGIAQVLFFQSDEPCEVSYKDKAGKYQQQRGVTLPKI